MEDVLVDVLRRRNMVKGAALTAVAAAFMSRVTGAHAQTTPSPDLNVLNFALNLEYLEAQFYSYAAYGTGISSSLLTGSGTQGTIVSGPTAAVPFTDRASQLFAQELARDELGHVEFLRATITAGGGTPVAMPNINIGTAFQAAGAGAGLGNNFTPYDNENDFLLGSYIFEDVGVTAYAGATTLLLPGSPYITPAAQILAIEAYHGGAIRAKLSSLGYVIQTAKISNFRATASGTGPSYGTPPDDVGIQTNAHSTLADSDQVNFLAFTRTPQQVLSVVYLGGTTGGGFFPNGVNGTITTA